MRISVLVENDPAWEPEGLAPEHGLSLHIDTGDHRILFDTGATGVFADNAAKMGIDIGAVDLAVLSHHHFDHGGGLARFLADNRRAPIYLRDCDDRNQTFRAFGVLKKRIGIDTDLLESHGDRFKSVDRETEIAPGISLLTDLAGRHPVPKGNAYLWVERNGHLMRDDFAHELAMVLRGPSGLVVVTGCSHSGIRNMVEAAAAAFPDEPVKEVIGGFHLIGNPLFNNMAGRPQEVEDLGRDLLSCRDATFHTGHCTGAKAFKLLKGVMGDRLQPFATGTVFEA